MKLLDFDLEKAKAGWEVCTERGYEVSIADFNSPVEGYPLTVYVHLPNGLWRVSLARENGYIDDGFNLKLKLKPKVRTGYVLMDASNDTVMCNEFVFDKLSNAEYRKFLIESKRDVQITIATITWEE